jgi:hypothetical protein
LVAGFERRRAQRRSVREMTGRRRRITMAFPVHGGAQRGQP